MAVDFAKLTFVGNMAVDKIAPNDSRVKRVTTEVNGQRWCKRIVSSIRDSMKDF